MVEVLCQLIAVVIVGEQALEKRQQLRETQNKKEKWNRWKWKRGSRKEMEDEEGVEEDVEEEKVDDLEEVK